MKNLPDLLEDIVIGDCRQAEILEQANIHHCQAVLLVTSDERINIETAFAVRLLNPQVRLIVRSSEQDLNQLLDQQLGNFAAFGASQLPTSAFAIAALSNEIQGLINLDDRLLSVFQAPIDASHRWCNQRLHELNSRTRRVLSHTTGLPSRVDQGFYQWEPNARIQVGDVVIYVELADGLPDISQPLITASRSKHRSQRQPGRWQKIYDRFRHSPRYLTQFWQLTAQQQTKRVAAIVGLAMLTLLLLGSLILKAAYPEENWLRALYVSGVMLLGSYDAVYAVLNGDTTPLWMRFMNLSYMLAGTASIAVLYALLTESLLAAKFQLSNRRPPLPLQNHVVLIGLDAFGRQIASFLQQLGQPLVGVSHVALPGVLPQMPLVVSDFIEALTKVNLATAKSVVVASDNEMTNLAIGLRAHAINPNAAIVIRAFEPDFSNNLDRLLPYAKVLCAYSLAAEAYAAAVFGDHILNVLQLNQQTVLVAEYIVQPEDHLNGLLLAEVAYGYEAVPILHQATGEPIALMPSEDTQLKLGDRLVVLATIDSLHRLARAERLPQEWQIQINKTLLKDAAFEGARVLTRMTRCSLSLAHELLNQTPGCLNLPLYKQQAQRIIREFSKLRVSAHLVSLAQSFDYPNQTSTHDS